MAYKKIQPNNIVNDIEYNLKELVEQELDGYYVFSIENSQHAVQSEPYKPVYYFQLSDTKRVKNNIIIDDEGNRGDIISAQYAVFILLNDDYNPQLKTKRDLNKISNSFVDTIHKKQEILLNYFEDIRISTQTEGTTDSPQGFAVNKHLLNITVEKDR